MKIVLRFAHGQRSRREGLPNQNTAEGMLSVIIGSIYIKLHIMQESSIQTFNFYADKNDRTGLQTLIGPKVSCQ